MKIKTMLATSVSTLFLATTLLGSVSVYANKWHSGTPKEVTGKWISNLVKSNNGYVQTYFDIPNNNGNNGINAFPYWYDKNKKFETPGSSGGGFWNARYKNVGSHKYIVESGHGNGVKNYPIKRYITMHGNKHLSMWTKDNSYPKTYDGYFKKVNRLPSATQDHNNKWHLNK